MAAANATPFTGNMFGSETKSWSSDGDDFGSPLSWFEESSEDELDYFAVLDLAASESSPQPDAHEESAPPARAIAEDHHRQKVVSKQSVGGMSRSGRHHWMGMERSHFQLDRGSQRDVLSSMTGTCIGEGDLRNLFQDEELKM
jgi:hypothetical protein